MISTNPTFLVPMMLTNLSFGEKPYLIEIWVCLKIDPQIHRIITRNTAFRRPWVFFVINGVSWMILDVPVPIGFCFDVIFKAVNPLFWCIFSKTNISSRRNYHFWGLWEFSKIFNVTCFDEVFKAVNPLFWCICSKTSIPPRRNYHFWCLWEFSKLIRPDMFWCGF